MDYLTDNEKQYIIDVLTTRPYREVYRLIGKIMENEFPIEDEPETDEVEEEDGS